MYTEFVGRTTLVANNETPILIAPEGSADHTEFLIIVKHTGSGVVALGKANADGLGPYVIPPNLTRPCAMVRNGNLPGLYNADGKECSIEWLRVRGEINSGLAALLLEPVIAEVDYADFFTFLGTLDAQPTLPTSMAEGLSMASAYVNTLVNDLSHINEDLDGNDPNNALTTMTSTIRSLVNDIQEISLELLPKLESDPGESNIQAIIAKANDDVDGIIEDLTTFAGQIHNNTIEEPNTIPGILESITSLWSLVPGTSYNVYQIGQTIGTTITGVLDPDLGTLSGDVNTINDTLEAALTYVGGEIPEFQTLSTTTGSLFNEIAPLAVGGNFRNALAVTGLGGGYPGNAQADSLSTILTWLTNLLD